MNILLESKGILQTIAQNLLTYFVYFEKCTRFRKTYCGKDLEDVKYQRLFISLVSFSFYCTYLEYTVNTTQTISRKSFNRYEPSSHAFQTENRQMFDLC